MKAFILSAGLGTRLRPLTELIPKPMIPISNVPILEYIIRYLSRSGINDIVINLHYLPELISDYFKDGSSFGVNINYSKEIEILGTAGGIKGAESFLKDDIFFVINSDIAFELNIDKIVQFHKKNNAMITMVLREDNNVDKYGAIEIDSDNKVKRFVGYPENISSGSLTKTMFTGIALFNPVVLKEFPEKGYYDIAKEIYPELIKNNAPVFGYLTDKYWKDMGNQQSYLDLQKDILDKKVFQNIVDIKGADNFENRFKGIEIIPPVIIGENTVIAEGSIIGPFVSVGKNCVINKGSTLKNSILWDNIVIRERSVIDNSIVYKNEGNYSGR